MPGLTPAFAIGLVVQSYLAPPSDPVASILAILILFFSSVPEMRTVFPAKGSAFCGLSNLYLAHRSSITSPEKVCAALPVWAIPRQQVIRNVMRLVFRVFTIDQFLSDF